MFTSEVFKPIVFFVSFLFFSIAWITVEQTSKSEVGQAKSEVE